MQVQNNFRSVYLTKVYASEAQNTTTKFFRDSFAKHFAERSLMNPRL